MIKRILIRFSMLVVLSVFIFVAQANAGDKSSRANCKNGICVEDNLIVLTESDVKALRSIYKKDEQAGLEFTDIRLKTIIYGSVYLLHAAKPNYYGIQVVLSKEGEHWIVLKKHPFVE